MLTETVRIVNRLGLHARSASKFVNLAKGYPCQIKIGLNTDSMQDGKSIMGVLTLAAEKGTNVILQTDGEEEREAMAALVDLIADRFGEGD